MTRILLPLFLIPFFIGCGPQTVIVTGRVTFEGEPMKDINVFFLPVADSAIVPPAAAGLTDANGFYRLRLIGEQKKAGVIPGEYAVFISWVDPDQDPFPEREGYVPNPEPYRIPDRALRGLLQFTVPEHGPVTADWAFTEEDLKEVIPMGY